MKKWLGLFVLFLATCFLVVACNGTPASLSTTGEMEISVNSGTKGIAPSISLQVVRYQVEGTHPDGDTFSVALSQEEPSRTMKNLAIGTWTVRTTGYNEAGEAIAESTTTCDIVAASTTICAIVLQEKEGDGTFAISIDLSASFSLADFSGEAVLSSAGVEVKRVALSIEDGKATGSTVLAHGFYDVLILISTHDEVVKQELDTVRIVQGSVSTMRCAMTIKQKGRFDISVSSLIMETPTITLEGTSSGAGSQFVVTINASVNDVQQGYAVTWYCDGYEINASSAHVQAMSDRSLTLGSLADGTYVITYRVVSADGLVRWSTDIDVVRKSSQITGVVKDATTVIAQATLTLTNTSGEGSPITTTSDSSGAYAIYEIPEGTYRLSVSKDGYDAYQTDELSFPDKVLLDVVMSESVPAGSCLLHGTVTIADTDTNMTNNAPLVGATVALTQEAVGFSRSTTTGSDGSYEFDEIPNGTYQVTISKDDYITVDEVLSIVGESTAHYDAVVESIPTSYEGTGTASGSIINAASGQTVSVALTLKIRRGIGNTTGECVDTLHISSGTYTTSSLDAGNYCVEILDERTLDSESNRFKGSPFNIKILGRTNISGQNGQATQSLAEGQVRIVLTWGASPSDLDSHLVGPSGTDERFHVSYSNKGVYVNRKQMVGLDVDDTSSYGPETTTIYSATEGIYTFFVHDYSAHGSSVSTALAQSGAKVVVYYGESSPLQFNVPSGTGTLWTVFQYDSRTGRFSSMNTLNNSSSSTIGSSTAVR